MFTRDSLWRWEAKLAIAALTALMFALMLLSASARPAHACLFPPSQGTDSFAAAGVLPIGSKQDVVNDGDLGQSSSCSFPQGITTTGNTSGATMEVGEPLPHSPTKDCGIFGISNSVWWKVKVPSQFGSNGAYLKLSTGGSSFDTVLAVYQGSSLTSLQQVACSNDNTLPNWNEPLIERLSSGQTYYVQLSGTGGARSGPYKLNASWRTGAQVAGF
jgi:hypothetical protein